MRAMMTMMRTLKRKPLNDLPAMKLYSKKLNGLDDLEKERKRLLKEKRELEQEKILSADTLLGSKGEGGGFSLSPELIPTIMSVAGPAVSTLVGVVKDRIISRREHKAEKARPAATNDGAPKKKREHKVLKAIAREFIGSYLKWKAVELSYMGLTFIIRRQKKKKAERKAQEATSKTR